MGFCPSSCSAPEVVGSGAAEEVAVAAFGAFLVYPLLKPPRENREVPRLAAGRGVEETLAIAWEVLAVSLITLTKSGPNIDVSVGLNS